ncbi:penicillin-binding protein 2B [Halobacillus karajensis]|uniref:serine-type D-Ala-D-Ala carboxypeptidase n=1 Tax=Halobacillus karajensis TaxID=195088 RepID=A0A024P307_9BACI|nr:Penicillin-binding protein B [Halobacillus karajensis]CDQ22306.1 Penicillin-binding protein B [Halobacillus karajensis]CDQ28147.1 Penicillin-binding protein B [Halobacillus karajensis]SEH71145.1 penicillin-binding protein 2B [Halobacillus karajensis]
MLILIFGIMFFIIAGRFIYIETAETVEGVDLQKWAEDIRTSSYEIDADRGKIFDKNGMVLAYDRPTYRIYAIVDEAYAANMNPPGHVTEPEETAAKLAPLLDMEASEIQKTIEEGQENDRFQVEFGAEGRSISQETKEEIEELELNGIEFKQESKRYYPNGQFASHVIGFARSQDGNINGVTGIEKQMEEHLQEEKGKISYERDKYGTKLLDPNEVMTEPEDGKDVYLTLDQKIQTFLEDALTQVQEEYNPKKVMAAVMDPDTGEILAMSNRPSYNPNNINDVENWYNDMVSHTFEPGSTMKMFTWAAAIEEGVYNGSDMFKSGTYKVPGHTIGDHNNAKGWGKISYDEGFQRSSNVASSKLALEVLGPTKLRKYLTAFNFDEKTGIDLPNEKNGRFVFDKPSEQATTSFGQGSTVTAIQLMTAATSIANDGKIMRPYMLSKITSSETGEVLKENKPEEIGNPISESTAKKVRDLMGTVVTSEQGTGQSFKLDDYTLAGKTGTAQISQNGKYLTGRDNYVFSFVGMAPKEDPELLMYVAVQQPELEATELGSEPVSYIIRTVMENSLHYMDIQPDKETDESLSPLTLPDLTDKSTSEAEKELKQTFDNVEVIGDGEEVSAILPAPGTKVVENQRIMIVTDQPTMPDLTGYSARDVHRLVKHFNLNIESTGNGFVEKQSIPAGSNIKEGGYLVVELAPPQSE